VYAAATDVALEMPVACTVQGRVHWAGENPSAAYMLALRHKESDDPMVQMVEPPRTAISNLTGHFRFTGVAPGTYMLTVMERYFDGDPIALIVSQEEPTMIDDRQILVEVGEPNFVDVELSPSGEGPKGSFVGRITSNGGPLAGLEVEVEEGGEVIESTTTNGAGGFETQPYSVMERYRVRIAGQIPQPDGSLKQQEIFNERRRPRSGDPERIDIDLTYSAIVVRVVDARTGEPLAGVRANLYDSERQWRRSSVGGDIEPSSSDGLLNVVLPSDEEYRLRLERDGVATTDVTVTASMIKGSAPHVTFELQAAVPCSGTIVVANGNRTRFWLNRIVSEGDADGEGESEFVGTHSADEEDMTFEVKGLMPGRYRASLWTGPGGVRNVDFELGPNGDQNLVLDFENAWS